MEPIQGGWREKVIVTPHEYTCFYCQRQIAPDKGFNFVTVGSGEPSRNIKIRICHNCNHPTYFYGGKQYPSPPFGKHVDHVPGNAANIYEEARNCMAVNTFTAAVMACRKILMHVAVEKGAKKGESFKSYVEHLSGKYISEESKSWVDLIRDKGNEANHEIVQMSKPDAEQMIEFTAMLLTIIYEYPAKIQKKTPATQAQQQT